MTRCGNPPSAGCGEQPAPAAQVAASRFFSAFIDITGQVWTFGGGYNGELGHSAAWAPSARRVSGEVQRVRPAVQRWSVAVSVLLCSCCQWKSGEEVLVPALPVCPKMACMQASVPQGGSPKWVYQSDSVLPLRWCMRKGACSKPTGLVPAAWCRQCGAPCLLVLTVTIVCKPGCILLHGP